MKGGKSKADTSKKADAKLSVKRKAAEKASKPAKKGKADKDPNMPKRPPSAFFVFMEEFRKQFKEKNPNNKQVSVVGKAAGEKWKSLSAAEKAPYESTAGKRKAEYNKAMVAYNKKQADGGAKKSVNKYEEEEESDKSKSEVHDDDDDEDEESGELNQAKELFGQDPEEKKGFQYDHVWPILCDAEKWATASAKEHQQFDISEGSESGSPASASPSASPYMDLNASDNQDFCANDDVGSSSRPLGRKKEKMRRRKTSENNQALDSIAEDNSEILNTLKKSQLHREEVFAKMKEDGNTRYQLLMLKAENERKKLELQQERQEKELMEKDLNTIEDPVEREYFKCKKKEILQKRQRESEMCGFSNQRGYEGGGYFPNDLPEY